MPPKDYYMSPGRGGEKSVPVESYLITTISPQNHLNSVIGEYKENWDLSYLASEQIQGKKGSEQRTGYSHLPMITGQLSRKARSGIQKFWL